MKDKDKYNHDNTLRVIRHSKTSNLSRVTERNESVSGDLRK